MSKPTPPKPFESDGCTLWPDGDYGSCCEAHDRAYWQGGTDRERLEADIALMRCVADKTGNTALARTMFIGICGGGTRWSPKLPWWSKGKVRMRHFRWGWGWNWPQKGP